MDKEKLFNDAANYLAGSCMSIDEALSSFCALSEHDLPEPTQSDLEEFELHLENIEMFCCENCGWWQYPGEGYCECDSEDNDED